METTVKRIKFKFSDYLSHAYEFYKNDMGSHIGAILLVILMSIIPFCGILALGNYYKFCRQKRSGHHASASDIFNFDDFMPYFSLQLIILGVALAAYLPLLLIMFFFNADTSSPTTLGALFGVWGIAVMVAAFYFTVKLFYVPALISLKGIRDIKTAWKISNKMTEGNFWAVLGFAIVVSFLGQLGLILCFVGIIITLPFYYISTYFAYEDALNQISTEENLLQNKF